MYTGAEATIPTSSKINIRPNWALYGKNGPKAPTTTQHFLKLHICLQLNLLNGENVDRLSLQDRPALMVEAKGLVYAASEDAMKALMTSATSKWEEKYPQFLDHLSALYGRRAEWALCMRDALPTRGHNTNNVVEAAFRVIKDSILHW